MGGIGWAFPVKRIAESKTDGMKLYEDVSELIVENIYSLAGTGPAMKAVMSNYDLRYGSTMNDTEPLHFGFYDGGGGCFLSMDLLMHWFILTLDSLRETPPRKKIAPLIEWGRLHGWEIPPLERSIEEEVVEYAKTNVFVELRGRYYQPSIYEGKPYLSFDDHPDRVTYATLTDDERALVDEMLEKRVCRCRLCASLLGGKRAKGPRVPKPKVDPLAGTVARKKEIRFSKEPFTEFPAVLRSAKQLSRLSFHEVPLTTLPEWIVELKLESLDLYQTNIRALPKLPPTLRSLSLWKTPVASLIGLDLPALEYLTVSFHDARVDLRSFPALRSLTMEYARRTTLPEGLTTLQRAYLKENQLRDVDALFQPGIHTVMLDGNPIEHLPDLPESLQYLSMTETKLASLPRLPTSLKTLFVNDTALGPWRRWIDSHSPDARRAVSHRFPRRRSQT